MKYIINLFLVLILALPISALASDEDYYVLSNEKKCFVKSYNNKKFKNVDPKKFQKIRIFATPHKKNGRYSVFKMKNQIYVTLTSCLDPVSVSRGEFEDLVDSEPEVEDYSYLNRAASNRTVSEGMQFNENKYYVELDAGSVKISDKNQIFPYDDLDGTFEGNVYDFGKPEKSSYKAKSSIALGGGWKMDEGRFLAFKIKSFKGSKQETAPVTVDGVPMEADFEFKDTFVSFLIGQKLIFWPEYKFKPILAGYLGLNHISSEFDGGEGKPLKLESSGLSALVEVGFEFLFTNNIGVGLTGGYEYLGKRTFKLKDESERVSGFKSDMSYSNTFFNLGLKVYFK